MRLFCHKDRWFLTLTTLSLVLFALSGCAMVGPKSISMGRADYNEAINRTEDEQMLLSIVKDCYGKTFSLLAARGNHRPNLSGRRGCMVGRNVCLSVTGQEQAV